MIKINDLAMKAILELAKSEREEGGIINRNGDFIKCTNLSPRPFDSFEFNLAEAGEEAFAIVHTHGPSSSQPTPHDRLSCFDSGLPWLVIGNYGESQSWISPKEDLSNLSMSLLDRPFVFEVMDCYHILKDYYKKLDVDLPCRPRSGRFWEDEESEYNPYIDEPQDHGFFMVDDQAILLPHDMLVMSIKSKRNGCGNHVGVYLGEGKMIHHPYNSLSCVSPYAKNTGWGKWTMVAFRHKNYKDFLNVQVKLDG